MPTNKNNQSPEYRNKQLKELIIISINHTKEFSLLFFLWFLQIFVAGSIMPMEVAVIIFNIALVAILGFLYLNKNKQTFGMKLLKVKERENKGITGLLMTLFTNPVFLVFLIFEDGQIISSFLKLSGFFELISIQLLLGSLILIFSIFFIVGRFKK